MAFPFTLQKDKNIFNFWWWRRHAFEHNKNSCFCFNLNSEQCLSLTHANSLVHLVLFNFFRFFNGCVEYPVVQCRFYVGLD